MYPALLIVLVTCLIVFLITYVVQLGTPIIFIAVLQAEFFSWSLH